jgi:hypothetical protein
MADVFRCDHCGQYAPLRQAIYAAVHDYTNAEGDDVWTIAITCGGYCSRSMTGVRVGGR